VKPLRAFCALVLPTSSDPSELAQNAGKRGKVVVLLVVPGRLQRQANTAESCEHEHRGSDPEGPGASPSARACAPSLYTGPHCARCCA
jgi:hypothetical protein